MKKFKTITLILFLASCTQPPEGYECDRNGFGQCIPGGLFYKETCDVNKQAKFIIECARAANPMSDEEGEDLVAQCDIISSRLFCTRIYQSKTTKEAK
jgi:hypothetical protein